MNKKRVEIIFHHAFLDLGNNNSSVIFEQA